jgi:hypothetical protein
MFTKTAQRYSFSTVSGLKLVFGGTQSWQFEKTFVNDFPVYLHVSEGFPIAMFAYQRANYGKA